MPQLWCPRPLPLKAFRLAVTAILCGFVGGGVRVGVAQDCELDGATDWPTIRQALWEVVEARSLEGHASAAHLVAIQDQASACVTGMLVVTLVLSAHLAGSGALAKSEQAFIKQAHASVLQSKVAWASFLRTGFPVFGAIAWLEDELGELEASEDGCCTDGPSVEFQRLVRKHANEGTSITSLPSLPLMQYLGVAAAAQLCPVGQAAALILLAASLPLVLTRGVVTEAGELQDVWHIVGLAEALVQPAGRPRALRCGDTQWPVWALLHQLSRAMWSPLSASQSPLGACIIMIYAFPTDEIRRDSADALRALEQLYFGQLRVQHPLIVFTDQATATSLESELGAFTSAPIVPAIIPHEELVRDMPSYSCVDGFDCVSGTAFESTAHRGVVNKTQFWSPDYLRISRYTAGPLFRHSALDSCGAFLKMDTDFFFTAPLDKDPLEELRLEGTRLAYWQIHVQGQRQAGFMDAAVSFLRERGLRIRNPAFYARGRFEEKAEKLGIPLSEVPEALEAATVVYGCLFGGDVRFFREPLYQDFFQYMDARHGFEQSGWSNQFFLGTAAAAFLFPSQVRRLYVSGRHQESKIDVVKGNVTEYLTGSSKSVFR